MTQRNPNSLANLKPFAPGQSGNPAGRPSSGPIMAPTLRKYGQWSYVELMELAQDEERAAKLTAIEVACITWLLKAGNDKAWGDQARQTLADRLDGKPEPSIQVNVQTNVQVNLKWHDGDDVG